MYVGTYLITVRRRPHSGNKLKIKIKIPTIKNSYTPLKRPVLRSDIKKII